MSILQKSRNNLGGYLYHLLLIFHAWPANQPAFALKSLEAPVLIDTAVCGHKGCHKSQHCNPLLYVTWLALLTESIALPIASEYQMTCTFSWDCTQMLSAHFLHAWGLTVNLT